MMFHKLTVLQTYIQSLLRLHKGNVGLSIFISVFSGLTKSGSFVLLLPLLHTAGSPEDVGGSSRAFGIANSIWNVVGILISEKVESGAVVRVQNAEVNPLIRK